jgi:two-component system cell cycle sensor histidine kinase/response regulator CckA
MTLPSCRPLILVVDDDPAVRLVLRHILEKADLTAVIAGSGQEALESLRREPGIALALLDVRMPELDGPQTLGLMRHVCPDLRVCFLTGDPDPYSVPGLLDMGAEAVISKPFAVTDLVRRVQEVLGYPAVRLDGQPVVP